ncbi:MAG TPA: putative Ig domain-containing protein, partial [Gammaproteobacteria bacterium]|nr:putative Ig domain-containing protein [Gammaproteobacteria bacterium]
QGGEGHDTLDGGEGSDILAGQQGNDLLRGGAGDDNLQGNEGDDWLEGGAGSDQLFGQSGVDTLLGGEGNDALLGGTEDDILDGGAGEDQLYGEAGNDMLLGGAGNDVLFGGDGNDILQGEDGADYLYAGYGNDALQGDAGNDHLFGESGNDTLAGGSGADVLNGGAGVDTLDGGEDSDSLAGGTGDDSLAGGLGHDTYVYNLGDGHDILSDTGAYDLLILAEGITPAMLTISIAGADVVLSVNSDDSITLTNAALGNGLDAIVFGDGSTLMADNFLSGADAGLFFSSASPVASDLTGTAGDDIFYVNSALALLDGGAGDDVYYFNSGTTTQQITDGSGNDTLVFRDGIAVTDLAPQLQDGNLTIVTGGAQVIINDWANNGIEEFVFSDGTWLDAAGFAALINHAPEFNGAVADQVTEEDAPFTVTLPADLFLDPDGEAVVYRVDRADGSPLPAWLSFDPATNVLSGTPRNGDVGEIDLQVTATDSGGLSVADAFSLTVNNVNDAPVAVPDAATLTLLAESANPGLTPAPGFRVTTDDVPGYNHSLARLAGGGYAVVWYNNENADYPDYVNTIQLRAYDSDGNAVGDIATLGTVNTLGGAYARPAIVGLADGGYFVAWSTRAADQGDNYNVIHGQRYDAAGLLLTDTIIAETPAALDELMLEITPLPSGGFLVTWDNPDAYGYPNFRQFVGQRFDANAQMLDGPVLIHEPSYSAASDFQLAAAGDGFAVVWEGNAIRLETFDAQWDLQDSVWVETNTMGRQYAPELITLAGGGLAVFWVTEDPAAGDASGTGIAGKLFDAYGNTIVDEFLVNTSTLGYQEKPSAISLPDGGFIVSWVSSEFGGSPDILLGQRFAADGAKIGNEFLVNEEPVINVAEIENLVMDNGDVLFTWTTYGSVYIESPDISGRQFHLGGGPVDNRITLDVLANDVEVDAGDALTLIGAAVQGPAGAVSIVDNKLLFDPGADFAALGGDEIVAVTIDYTLQDAAGVQSASTVTLAIGKDGADGLGTIGNDIIDVPSDRLVILAGDGNDIVNLFNYFNSMLAPVTVFGGNGDDQVNIGSGHNITVHGEAGDDAITVNNPGATPGATYRIRGGSGNNTI